MNFSFGLSGILQSTRQKITKIGDIVNNLDDQIKNLCQRSPRRRSMSEEEFNEVERDLRNMQQRRRRLRCVIDRYFELIDDLYFATVQF